ncbi:DNA cytosine methyltransferase [Jeotgalibacillus aurantiacus]|uniref:DNA cytosine methyltransferase n=1 Tax=Jeotgalibacillus aurantiacus TaxID=2763266 RepID=UPI001D0AE5AF|nr:DNA cytosine methyltransferase [Jeotgalibacillus aurantiacus]
MKKPLAIDIFCGAGGVSQALKNFFNIITAVEYDPIIAKTYELNHGSEHLIINDVEKLTKEEFIKMTNLKVKQLDLLVSTPPCQGFSRHSRKKAFDSNDHRNKLILETTRISDIFHPKYIFFENVDNIINYKVFHTFLRRLVNLNKLGYKRNENRPSYHINFKVVSVYKYGVPQKRRRLILLAKRIDDYPFVEGVIKFPKDGTPIIGSPLNVWPKEKSSILLGEHLSKYELKPIEAGETDPSDPLHTCRNLSALNLKRIKSTPHDGGSRNAWPEELLLNCHKKSNVSFGDVYGRMDRNDFAPTITCGCISYTKGRFGHPTEDRAISLREAALIQTFPSDYKFTGELSDKPYKGSKDNMATQIGNAVPVKLAETFIKELYSDLINEKNRE